MYIKINKLGLYVIRWLDILLFIQPMIRYLCLVKIVGKVGEFLLETLSLSASHKDGVSLGLGVEGVFFIEGFPMIEDALREGLAGGEGSQVSSETEGVSDREVSLDVEEGSSHNGFFGEDDSSSLREALVDTVHDVVGGGDVDEVDGLLESGLGGVLASVEDSSGSGDDLGTT